MSHTNRQINITHEVYALLWVTKSCEFKIFDFMRSVGVPAECIQRGMHLTVYHARRHLPGLPVKLRSRYVAIGADTIETRFMVLAPGGENPRPDLLPARRSVGIRLTKRNCAKDQILALRREMCAFETPAVIGTRTPSTDWTNCFGARHYQPHVKLLRPGSGINRDLTKMGELFRSQLRSIEFGKFLDFDGLTP